MFFRKKSKKSTEDAVNQIGRDMLNTMDGTLGYGSNNYVAPPGSNYALSTNNYVAPPGSNYALSTNNYIAQPVGYDAYSSSAVGYGGGLSQTGTASRILSTGTFGGLNNVGQIDDYSRTSGIYNRGNDYRANEYLSRIESSMLNAAGPISSNENEEITVNGYRGVWLNKAEIDDWQRTSQIPITKYDINVDPNPELITKRADQRVEYQQELAVRYLRPPTPPPPGELIIREENVLSASAAPPIIIRQRPPRAPTPEPIIIREAPPPLPPQIGRKVVTIKKSQTATAPRKLIVEKLPALPPKPQSIIVEKWLPYPQQKRRVIYQKSADVVHSAIAKQRNTIIQWELPEPLIRKEYKYLGVINANPAEYIQRYGTLLKRTAELPTFLSEIKTPADVITSVNYRNTHELEGDLEALRLFDLDQEGLGEYKAYINRYGYGAGQSSGNYTLTNDVYTTGMNTSTSNNAYLESLIEEAFYSVDTDRSGTLDIDEASKLLLRLNSRLGRSYGENEAKAFFAAIDVNGDRKIDIREFKRAFLKL